MYLVHLIFTRTQLTLFIFRLLPSLTHLLLGTCVYLSTVEGSPREPGHLHRSIVPVLITPSLFSISNGAAILVAAYQNVLKT